MVKETHNTCPLCGGKKVESSKICKNCVKKGPRRIYYYSEKTLKRKRIANRKRYEELKKSNKLVCTKCGVKICPRTKTGLCRSCGNKLAKQKKKC